MDELFSIRDRVTLVSGASRGIGRCLAEAFAQRGAPVIITGREQATIEQTAAEISTAEVRVKPLVCDVAQADDIRRTVEAAHAEFGRIDVLLNVAGINQRQRAETFTDEDYDRILDVNLKGAFVLSREVGRHMIERRAGVQVNIASLNSYAPLPGVLPYAMSKGGMATMTRGLAIEWGQHGIRVNALAPGFILTDLTRKLWSQPHMQEWSRKSTPLGRLGEVKDLIGAAVFLASDASAFMTGQVIYVDGGVVAGIPWPIEL